MKIKIARSLAEPLTIPWLQIKADEKVKDIMAEIQRYLDFLKDKGWTNSFSDGTETSKQDLSSVARDTLLRSLRILTRNAGGVDVWIRTIEHHDEMGYTFWIFFNTHEDGPKHSKDFSIVKRD